MCTSVGPLEKTILAELNAIKVACRLVGTAPWQGESKEAARMMAVREEGWKYFIVAAGIGYQPEFCLTSSLMMLEATVNSGFRKFTDDAKSGGVINSSEDRAKPWRG